MQPIGNKYLIKVEKAPAEEKVDGIIIPSTRSIEDIHYRGTVVEHGTYMTEKELVPINSKVLFNWRDKDSKTKLSVDGELYYICDPKAILAIEEVTE